MRFPNSMTILAASLLLVASACTEQSAPEGPEGMDSFALFANGESGDIGDPEPPPIYNACTLAPSVGTLAIVEITAPYSWTSSTIEEYCSDDWPYKRRGYADTQVRLVENLAGPEPPLRFEIRELISERSFDDKLRTPGERHLVSLVQMDGVFVLFGTLSINGGAAGAGEAQPVLEVTDVDAFKAELATTVATKPTQCTDESTGRVTSRGWDERDDLLKFVYGEAFRTRECEMLREGPIDDGSFDNL